MFNLFRDGRWTTDQRLIVFQFVRFGIAGLVVAVLQVAIYNSLVTIFDVTPQASNALASAIILVVAYTVHSGFTFRGHGTRDNLARTGGRFAIVHFVGWLTNTAWVWLLVTVVGVPSWVASVPMLTATPLLLFYLKRNWVFV